VHRALWLLTWLRFRGWLRRMTRNVRTVKGALTAVLGVLILGFCLISWVLSLLFMPVSPDAADRLEQVRRYGPFGLLAMALLTLITSSSERAMLPFSPAEVNLLFSGPFTRRQLISYKLMVSLLSVLLAAAFFLLWASFLRAPGVPALVRYAGLVLALSFVQLFTIVLGFLANAVGARAYNRGRRLALLLLAVLLVAAVWHAGRNFFSLNPGDMLERFEQSPVTYYLLTPFRCFVLAATSERLWPDFAQWAGLSLLVDAVMVFLVFVLDAHYLETAAMASERLYAQVQRLRRGGAAATVLRSSGKVRFSLPSLPWLGGIGPIAWRQLQAIPRSRATFIFIFVLLPFAVLPLLPGMRGPTAERAPIAGFVGGYVITMTVFMSAMFAFDFRGDVDRIDVLKSLPIRPAAMVVGQLTAPVVFVSFMQGLVLAVIAYASSKETVTLALCAAIPLTIPFNFLLFGVDNLLFLLFPTRHINAAPGDFHLMGRYVLLNLAKFLTLGLAVTLAAIVALPVYLLTHRMLPGLAAAWLILAACAAALVPFLAIAYRQFDVAHDTPP
jgi:Putative ABC exporter